MPENEFSRLLLALVIGIILAGMARLAFRKTAAERFRKSSVHPTHANAAFGEFSLRQSLEICTPAFLGFSLIYLSFLKSRHTSRRAGSALRVRRHAARGAPTSGLKARLNEASDA